MHVVGYVVFDRLLLDSRRDSRFGHFQPHRLVKYEMVPENDPQCISTRCLVHDHAVAIMNDLRPFV